MFVNFPFRLTLSVLMPGALALVLSGCNQSSGVVNNQVGRSYYSQGNWTAARHEFERALIDSPENPNYAYNTASAMAKQGDMIAAERMFRHALNLDPRHQPSHHGLAALLTQQGREAEAQMHLQEWTATQPNLPESHIEMAWMQRQQGDLAGAEASLRQALQIDPHNSTAMAQLGQLYHETGRPQEAHSLYQHSLAQNPFQTEVKTRMQKLAGIGRPNAMMPMGSVPPQMAMSPGMPDAMPAGNYGVMPIPTQPYMTGPVIPAGATIPAAPDPNFQMPYGMPAPANGPMLTPPMTSPQPLALPPGPQGPVNLSQPSPVPVASHQAMMVAPF